MALNNPNKRELAISSVEKYAKYLKQHMHLVYSRQAATSFESAIKLTIQYFELNKDNLSEDPFIEEYMKHKIDLLLENFDHFFSFTKTLDIIPIELVAIRDDEKEPLKDRIDYLLATLHKHESLVVDYLKSTTDECEASAKWLEDEVKLITKHIREI